MPEGADRRFADLRNDSGREPMLRRVLPIRLLLVVASFVGMAFTAHSAGLTDPLNRHNLSSGADPGHPRAQLPANGGTDEICVFCHTPHSASAKGPLWNRPDVTTSFPLYNSATLVIDDPGVVGDSGYTDDGSVTYPNGASRLCLSCHDGVTAVNVVLSQTTPIEMTGVAGAASLADLGSTAIVDLATSHPVSFTYNPTVRDAILAQKPGEYQLPLLPDVPLDDQSRMQCTTCHDPHEDTRADGTSAYPFWRHTSGADDYTEVCNTCHLAPTGSPSVHPL